ncbi:hypothetical protein K431DRAFT_143320 [Polychaeton citri CBS 116435]|uniref:Uncharacterized protein n=1 Tax=Polychaeton citri CBS 116435 TaxID=1314669 RepID=A0A9P4Q205_9PEZI|nr:hypothetical protein K431DRAFT_143320 [Polychaeton citri CBS 116435]
MAPTGDSAQRTTLANGRVPKSTHHVIEGEELHSRARAANGRRWMVDGTDSVGGRGEGYVSLSEAAKAEDPGMAAHAWVGTQCTSSSRRSLREACGCKIFLQVQGNGTDWAFVLPEMSTRLPGKAHDRHVASPHQTDSQQSEQSGDLCSVSRHTTASFFALKRGRHQALATG